MCVIEQFLLAYIWVDNGFSHQFVYINDDKIGQVGLVWLHTMDNDFLYELDLFYDLSYTNF
ncbi:hypothetical protein [Entomospira culicis]|uniref:hypothetical protein n=1 Tax=Entomospira culicis TaxID=2719989 RepID=UPI002368B846|nr:hypothetical protein [Entomospira culicis]WDI37348.1 hypothetical protein PVA46_00740 [Entomospira culicis]